MPTVLQITDKPSPGGGIRRVVDQHRAMLEGQGWACRELRLVPQGQAGHGVTTAPIEVALRLPGDAASVRAVQDAARRADVVHLHLGFASLSPAVVAAVAAVAPLVVNLHDVSPFEGLGLPQMGVDARDDTASLAMRLARWRLGPVRRAVWRRICQDAQAIVAPSHYLARLAQAAGAPAGRIVVVPHAVDRVVMDVPPPSACGPVIVYAGLLDGAKGAPLLLQAFGLVRTPGAHLVFVGNGPARAMMEKLGTAGVSFRGQLPAGDVAGEIAQARVLAHPSLVPEGFGLVGIEAMQLGRPVAGFGLGGCTDWLIAGKTGLVAARQDAAPLAVVLDMLLADGALADRLGAAGQHHVTQAFAPARVTVALLDVLQWVMRARVGQG